MNLAEERFRFTKKIECPSQKEIDDNSYSLALFSANIKKFLPSVSQTEYKKMFELFLYSKWMSGSEQYCVKYLRNSKIVNHSSINLNTLEYNQPLIFASFHFGSLRLFNSYLFELGHKIVIIIDDSIAKQQKDEILYKVAPLLNSSKGSDFVILNVQDRTSLFKIKQYISKGYIMTVYLDGNTGINVKSQDFSKNYILIRFLNQEIYVKNGVSKLAVLLNAKIIPVISYRDDDENSTIEFYQDIEVKSYTSKQDFIAKSIGDLYKILEEKIYKYPSQWTSWLTLHKLFIRNYSTPFADNSTLINKFNHNRYTTFVVQNSYFIFDLLDYKSFHVSKEVAKSLENNDFTDINNSLLEELKTKTIII